ncbi:MAG: hypothetical protein IJ584_07835 [Bacteroidales bacterium]|nr:hypothetical protein [Bacteroidales bacterium]
MKTSQKPETVILTKDNVETLQAFIKTKPKTIAELLRERPSLIEDLQLAASIVKMHRREGDSFGPYLTKLADELRPYDYHKERILGHIQTTRTSC